MLNIRPHTANQTGVSTCWRPLCFPGRTSPNEDTGQDAFSPHRQTVCVTLKLRLNYGKFTENPLSSRIPFRAFTSNSRKQHLRCRHAESAGILHREHPPRSTSAPAFFQARFLLGNSFRNFSVNPAPDIEKTQHDARRHNKHFPSLKPPIFLSRTGGLLNLLQTFP